ncbi:MAG: 3'-5' exonuclease [Marinomonas sp.]|uniref:3'-5' exonuclease n=1 Tax=Marinomonas sp. TaxID=1904862 RepID=UPI003F96C5AC
MNGNELAIIVVALIGLPLCLFILIKMPNANRCSSCGVSLNVHRQKSYYSILEGKNAEVCERCYKCGTPLAPRKTKSQQVIPANTQVESNSISEMSNELKPQTRSAKPQQVNPVSARGEIKSITNGEIKHVKSSSNQQQTDSVSTLGDSISISEVLEEIEANNCLWLDTETTGLSNRDEIIELSICTRDKQVVFDSILTSKVPCSAQARAVHGITDEQIANGMPIESAKTALLKLLEGKTIISFNVDFDCKMLFQTFGITTYKRFCVMKWSQSALDYEKWPRLEKVCVRLNVEQPKSHRSLVDTNTTIDIFNKLLDLTSNHKSLIRDFASIDLNIIERLEDGEALFLSPNSNIFAFDRLMDRHGNDIIGIRSKALKRMLTKEGTRIFVKSSRKGKTLKVQYLAKPDMQLPISMEELGNRLGALRLKKVNPNKYLSLSATIVTSNIDKATNDVIDGTYYLPSIAINEKIYESLDNLPIFQISDTERIAFTIKKPKNTFKRLFALGLQGYSSILKVVEHDNKVHITAYHLLDAQKITVLNSWELDGEKSWSGDY